MKKLKIILLLAAVLQLGGVAIAQKTSQDWKGELKEQLLLHGHRNWILIVDAAYPFQSKPAIKTIWTGGRQLDVVKEVLEAIDAAPHIYPEVFLDKEIDFVPENEAKGIEDYRKALAQLLEGRNVTKELHEELIATIDDAAKTFHILVLKTDLTIPYTSVFLRLDCGYWNGEQEGKMRKLMSN